MTELRYPNQLEVCHVDADLACVDSGRAIEPCRSGDTAAFVPQLTVDPRREVAMNVIRPRWQSAAGES
jgi:hypothetical protein